MPPQPKSPRDCTHFRNWLGLACLALCLSIFRSLSLVFLIFSLGSRRSELIHLGFFFFQRHQPFFLVSQRLLKVKFFKGSHSESIHLDQMNSLAPLCAQKTGPFSPLLFFQCTRVCCEQTSFPITPLSEFCSLLDSRIPEDKAILPPLHTRREHTAWMLRRALINESLHGLLNKQLSFY